MEYIGLSFINKANFKNKPVIRERMAEQGYIIKPGVLEISSAQKPNHLFILGQAAEVGVPTRYEL